MPQTHDIAKKFFVQHLTNYHAEWNGKRLVRGWSQEIEPPYRTSAPFLLRLRSGHVLVFGMWSGKVSEEVAMDRAVQRRDLTDNDFREEAGWTPAPDETPEEDSWYLYA
jgi:hypothetical protein